MNRTIDGKMNLFKRSLSEHQIDLKGAEVQDLTIKGNATVSGDLSLPDSKSIFLGSSNDFQIIHDGSNSYIDEQGTGNLFVRTNGNGIFFAEAGDSSNRIANFERRGRVQLKHNLVMKFETSANGVVIDGDIEMPDGGSLFLGDSKDFQIIHSGSTYIDEQGGGDLYIRTNGSQIAISDTTSSTNYMCRFIKDGAVELYHNKVKKFDTTATGITILGDTLTTNTLVASGSGFSTSGIISPRLSITNGFTKASFLIDLGEGVYSASSGTIIGENNSNPHFLTRLTEATYGLIYRIFMVCLEPLAGGETDIDVSVSTSSLSRGQNTGIGVVINGGTQQTETTYLEYETLTGQALEDRYLYLTTGAGSNTNAYTAGKLLIVVEGYKL